MSNQKQGGFHYAWIIAAMGCVMIFTTIGIIMTSFSAVKPYLAEAYNLTQGQNGLLTTIRTYANMISLLAVAGVYKKISVRWGATLGMAFSIVGYAILGIGSTYTHAVIAMILFGFSRSFAGMIGVSMLVKVWFNKYRSTMFGFCSCVSGFTTFVMPPILSRTIEGSGWQSACFLVSGILVVLTLLVALLVRDDPSVKGLEPLGGADFVEAKKASKKVVHHNYQADRTTHIIMLAVACLSAMCYAHGDFNTLNLTTAGWSKADAAQALSYYGLCLLAGKFIYGWIADHLPMRKASIIYYGCMSIAFIILANVRFPFFTIGVAVVTFAIYAMGGALCTNGLSSFALDMSPSPEKFGKTVQQYNFCYNFTSAIMCWIAGISADITGGYSLAYWGLLVCAIVGFVLVQYAYIRADKNWKAIHANDAVEANA